MTSTATVPTVQELHGRALAAVDAAVHQLADDQLSLPTPCADWGVRALVNHVVGEARWTAPLLAGLTIGDVGDRLDGDLLGADPRTAWAAAREEAAAAVASAEPDRLVHLSFGDVPAAEYLRQLAADYAVHAWDLAIAIGADPQLDPELVASVGAWFAGQAEVYRGAGVVAAEVPVPADAAEQQRLLAAFGRDVERCTTMAAVARFGAAFARRDVDAVLAAMTDDCVFESTAPPDGIRYEGRAAVRGAWRELFAGNPSAVFETEEQIVCGDRVTSRWRYEWPGGHVRGVDVYRVRDGRVAEKLSYVKG